MGAWADSFFLRVQHFCFPVQEHNSNHLRCQTLKKYAKRRHLVLNLFTGSPPPPPCIVYAISSVQSLDQILKEYEESLQKKATAAGFARPADYFGHELEKDPHYCRICYENYKKCLSEKGTMCEFRIEFEADYIGLMLMASAGYDPRDAPKVYEVRLGDEERGLSATHPSGFKRA
ncbi:hypothetical protein ACSBR1_007120 [Camellia fascicularis]